MSKQSNHQADISNANKGTSGTNRTYDQNQGNRGAQMNPNGGARSSGGGGGSKGGSAGRGKR